jgi:Tol biopolymer transport system component
MTCGYFDKIRPEANELVVGTKLAQYEVTTHLGSGGMGDVYQATDTKLHRSVAIKLLPEAFSKDSERIARFQREARVLALLNHSNIAAIYGVEEIDGRHFLVMELVPGETLADRIHRGAIPIEEALPIARQITDALEEAHEKGVIHRDLKPANIKVTPDGKVKVLDFGLAKAAEADRMSAVLSNSPTLMSASIPGVLLGTAAYMSPEQASGKAVEKRTDLWSFGVVLMEMLTGRAVFEGETVSHVLAAVLTKEPNWNVLPAKTPAPIRRLLRRCLEKDWKRRMADTGDARLEIDEAFTGPSDEAATEAAAHRTAANVMRRVALIGGLLTIVLLTVLPFLYYSPTPAPRQVRFPILIPENTRAVNETPLISPDGTRVALLLQKMGGLGELTLWIRDLDLLTVREIAGVSPESSGGGRSNLIWSSDSRSIAFLSNGKLRKVSVEGGPVQVICDANSLAGGTWGADGVIVFGTTGAGIMRVSDSGGTPIPLTKAERRNTVFRSPQLLPDGRLLFGSNAAEPNGGLYVTSLTEGAQTQQILHTEAGASLGRSSFSYMPPRRSGDSGTLLYITEDQVVAQSVNPKTLNPIGGPNPIAEHVSAFSTSLTNALVFSSTSAIEQTQELVWVDRTGTKIASLGLGQFQDLALSPDGKRIAYSSNSDGNGNSVWIHELRNTAPSRLTFDQENNRFPVWSADNQWLVFSAGSGRSHDRLIRKDAATLSKTETILSNGSDVIVQDWSPDGKFLLYRDIGKKTGSDLWLLPMNEEKPKPVPYLQTPANEIFAKFSPDGRWIAYQSNELGRDEVFVQSFPVGGGKYQVSTKGGRSPKWRRDGRELFYISAEGDLVSVKVDFQPRPNFSPPQVLFRSESPSVRNLDISADGNRILKSSPLETGSTGFSPPFTVILNWQTPSKQ